MELVDYEDVETRSHEVLASLVVHRIISDAKENNNIENTNKENLILSFQRAAQADGYDFPKYGCDGYYGTETEAVMKICIVKQRKTYENKNSTKLV